MGRTVGLLSEQRWVLKSPDSRIQFSVVLDGEGKLQYDVKRDGKTILGNSPLGIVTDRESFTEGLSFRKAATALIDETYTLPHGKISQYVNRANELTLDFDKNGHELQLVCRAYNDGIAFRYQIPGEGELQIASEPTGFVLPQDSLVNVWAQKFMKCYERTYDLGMLELLDEEDYAFPMLLQVGNDGWMLLTEAAVYGDYCASHVKINKEKARTLDLAFAPDQPEPNAARAPFATPWRAAIIGGNLATIVESALVFHLNPPSEVEDMSWIKPGRSAWSWHSDSASCRDHEKQ